MSTPERRIPVRDYKVPRRQGVSFFRPREFGSGLFIGLALATLAFFYGRSILHREAVHAEPQKPVPENVAPPDPEAPAPRKYDFYEMLQKFEFVVPEKDREVKRDLPSARVERPGVYVLQAGTYRNFADADRVRAQLARLGLDAKVQRVAVDADVWHRVRIGPISDLNQLNRARAAVRAADVDALVIRVGD